jgi:hypothetical protein
MEQYTFSCFDILFGEATSTQLALKFLTKFQGSRNKIYARYQWLIPVILVTQDAEIRKVMVCETISQKNLTQKKDWWSDSSCRP